MSEKPFDVAVIGLGIVGACAAYACARAGARVLAIDAGEPGHGTSFTSFAWLNSVRKEPEHYHRLNADGMAAHRELAKELGGDAGHHEGGSLEWAEDDDAARELRERVERLAARGYPAEWISRQRAISMEPGLAIPESVREVAFFSADAWLDAPLLIRRMLESGGDIELRTRTPVRALRARSGEIDSIVTDAGELFGRQTLVCVGPATQTFLDRLDIVMPVETVPGLLAMTSPVKEPLHRVIHAPGVHLRPDDDGQGLRIGAEHVDAPAAKAVSDAELSALADDLLRRAAHVFPAAREATIVRRRVGVRPMPSDRHTIAGRIPGLQNGWMIATHSGITLGPLLGRLMADEIVRGMSHATLAPFRPDRFQARAAG